MMNKLFMETATAETETTTIASRLGPEAHRRRLQVEIDPRKIPRDTGNWRETLAWRLKPHALLGFALKASFLWGRGYRNFLDLRVVEVPVTLPRLPAGFHGFRILQLSDLHLDLAPALLPVIRKRLSGIGYDLAVLTGDFKNLTHNPSGPAIELMQALQRSFRPPLYATLGNHDTLDMVEPLEAAGIPFLLNESVTLERKGESICLAGVDDSYLFHTDDIPRALAGVPPERFKILLSHAPSNYREAAQAGIDYFIAGHTHGGQICLRKGNPLVPSGCVPPELISGRWKHGKMYGYTSPGTGGCHLPIRFNCPGEITIHVLKSPAVQTSATA